MKQRIWKLFSFIMAVCIMFFATTTVFAKETITNMTYEEWLAEQENCKEFVKEKDMEPVYVPKERESTTFSQKSSSETGNKNLNTLLAGKESVDVDESLQTKPSALEMTESIICDEGAARTAPTASLIPVIANEDSLVNFQE